MYSIAKRGLDIVVAASGLLILFPVLLLLALLVRVNLGSPIIFKQVRPGFRGKSFELLKFRSMLDARDEFGNPLPNNQRMTPFGSLLRSTSADELPELWNILTGDMSLVGPRPLLVEYLPLYSDEQRRRHDVPPGLTGWSQVNGRNALTWEEKFKLDVWYVDNASLLLDLRILLMTFVRVLRRDGVTHGNDVAMPRFRGSAHSED